MSQYLCSCGDQTDVIDTRRSSKRLRRRRKCPQGHRFSTLEVPLDSGPRLKALVLFWAQELGDPEMAEHLNQGIDMILLGTPLPDD
jgi:hypothetical protein